MFTVLKTNHRNKQEAVLKATAVRVPCGVSNVINSSLFINSSLSSTSHAVRRGGGSGRGEGAGDISVQLSCTALPHGASPKRDFAQKWFQPLGPCLSAAMADNGLPLYPCCVCMGLYVSGGLVFPSPHLGGGVN